MLKTHPIIISFNGVVTINDLRWS